MFMTSTVYQHYYLVHTSNQKVHPVFIGQASLHKDATSETYAKFFTKIKTQMQKGLSSLVIGSDQEGGYKL